MEKTFNYYRGKSLFFMVMVPILFLLFIFSVAAIKGNEVNILIYLIIAMLFALIFILIHRFFLVKIIFTSDAVIYKSLFKRIEFKKEDIRDVVFLKHNRKASPDIVEFTEDLTSISTETSFYFLIGCMEYYPSSPYTILFKPVTSEYITFQYREAAMKEVSKLLKK